VAVFWLEMEIYLLSRLILNLRFDLLARNLVNMETS
jgi:hypothetical protein